jgi:ADP-ribosyl-[dinitrogen reductase] hydrolase
MPLEFGPMIPADRLVREMRRGRLPAGTFTDDTEMALALAASLCDSSGLDAEDVAKAFVAWHKSGPPDEGIHTRLVLEAIADGKSWRAAARNIDPSSAGNGSLMRCWPVALAFGSDLESTLLASRTQSEITHAHPDCLAACAFVNAALWHLVRGHQMHEAVALALDHAGLTGELRAVVEGAPGRTRTELKNSGWVRHTVEAAVWGLLSTDNFEEAVVQVVNLGNDADTAGSVVGALAGAAYGLDAIPVRWRQAVRGEWPVRSGRYLGQQDLIDLADALSSRARR